MSSSLVFRHRSTTLSRHVLHSLAFLRSMGGGPRTFPGGINKWQWKRLHEKKAQEKEKRLLQHEKQLYQARVRSDIRAKLAPSGSASQSNPNVASYSPLSPQQHIKALADRFMKEGAEDLWNEADGPLTSPPPQNTAKDDANFAPIELRKLISDQRNVTSGRVSETSPNLKVWSKPRNYSVYLFDRRNSTGGNLRNFSYWSSPRFFSVQTGRAKRNYGFKFRGNDSSSSEDDSDASGNEGLLMNTTDRSVRVPKLSAIGYDHENGGTGNGFKFASRAALGNYDKKAKKRIPLKFSQEDDLSQHVAAIRDEFNKRNMAEKVDTMEEEDSILSEKRFDECDISQLTVKALSAAGYVQMTKVQEATLSACLGGKDALVKAKSGTGKSIAFLF